MKKLILAALLTGAVATPAFAQDDDADAVASFTGPRVELMVGVDRYSAGPRDIVNNRRDSERGIVYGIGAGFDIAAGPVVFGIEGEASQTTTNQCQSNVIVADDELCANVGRDIYVGGRLGARVSSRAIVYLKGGYSMLKPDVDYSGAGLTPAEQEELDEELDEITEDLNGARFGLGFEFAMTENTFLKAEYRYTDYERNGRRIQGVLAVGFRF